MNPDNDEGKGDNVETQRAMLKMQRKERKQIKKQVKYVERQKEEERKKLELKFGPTDNRVRIISREFASKLTDPHEPQTNDREILQLTPNDFPSLDEIVYKPKKNVIDVNGSTFEYGVINERCVTSGIDINVSKPTQTFVLGPEPVNILEDRNYVSGDPNDINLSAPEELDFICTQVQPNKPRRKRAGTRKRKPRVRMKRERNATNLIEVKELNQPDFTEFNLCGSKEFTVPEPNELNICEPSEINLLNSKELNLAEPRELRLYRPNEFNLSQTEELNTLVPNEFNLSKPKELNILVPNEFNLSKPNEINLSKPNEQNTKKTKRANFGPITVSISDLMQKSKTQLRKEAKEKTAAKKLRERERTRREREKKISERYEGNVLDASQPDRQRGKRREFAKQKKPSKLKQLIHRDEEEVEEEETETELWVGKPKYSECHINYSNNVITEELDTAVTAFLTNIVQFQENLFDRDPIKACVKRRYMVGFRIVRKFLLLKKIKILVVSPDIKTKRKGDTLDNMINNIVSLAAASEIPYVFALSRRKLGQITLKNVPISCVAVANCDGTEAEFEKVLQLIQVTRAEYQKTKPLDAQEELTKEIIDDFLSFV